jgi:hypothetical protein
MSSLSLEAFDGNLKGKLSQWILPPNSPCILPDGFQDQILHGPTPFQHNILLTTKQESKAWLVAHPWDMVFTPEQPTDWSLFLSIVQQLKRRTLIMTTPKCRAPQALWQKLSLIQPQVTSAVLTQLQEDNTAYCIPTTVFFPKLDHVSESQFSSMVSTLHSSITPYIQSLDLRSIYRELRGAGASLCISLTDSRSTVYHSMWYYPEENGALRLHTSEARMMLRTVTERLAEPN